MQIAIDKIKASPFQPRLEFDLEDLRGSIIKDGILTPLTVRKVNENHYELIDGERRLRLVKDLGYKDVSCTVIDVDDETADRMVWKVNTLRKDYKPKEKALHYKHHFENGMRMKGIAENHDERPDTVKACLNTLDLPQKYQEMVWSGPLSLRHIETLAPLINGNGITVGIIKVLDEVCERKLTSKELEGTLKPHKQELETKRIELAQEATKDIKPGIKIETPEDYEKAAEALKREAKKRREETITPEEKAELEAKKQEKIEEQKIKKEEMKHNRQEQILQKAKSLKKEELIKDKKFIREVYREHEALESEQLAKELEDSRVQDTSGKPEIFLRIEVRRWIAQLLGIVGRIRNFDLKKLTPEELRATLEAYMLMSHELKTIFGKYEGEVNGKDKIEG